MSHRDQFADSVYAAVVTEKSLAFVQTWESGITREDG